VRRSSTQTNPRDQRRLRLEAGCAGDFQLDLERRRRKRPMSTFSVPAITRRRSSNALRNAPAVVYVLLRHLCGADLAPGDQPALQSLTDGLLQDVLGDGIGLDEVDDRPQGARELESLRRLNIARWQVGAVKDQDVSRPVENSPFRRLKIPHPHSQAVLANAGLTGVVCSVQFSIFGHSPEVRGSPLA